MTRLEATLKINTKEEKDIQGQKIIFSEHLCVLEGGVLRQIQWNPIKGFLDRKLFKVLMYENTMEFIQNKFFRKLPSLCNKNQDLKTYQVQNSKWSNLTPGIIPTICNLPVLLCMFLFSQLIIISFARCVLRKENVKWQNCEKTSLLDLANMM